MYNSLLSMFCFLNNNIHLKPYFYLKVGRLLMRKAVSEGIGQPYDKIMFSRTSSGKPYIEENSKFSFNVSHHGDFCVLAAEQDANVGVDVMKVEYKGKPIYILRN